MARVYPPIAVANEFIDLSPRGLDHMKVQKLVYYAQGYALALGFELTNEQPQVWKLGPVFKSLYFELKYHGEDPITSPEEDEILGKPLIIRRSDIEAHDIVDQVWRKFKRYTALQLSDLTHRKGTPWREVVEKYHRLVPRDTFIAKEKMASYFKTHTE